MRVMLHPPIRRHAKLYHRDTSIIPATMAAIYLLLFLYFKSIGGYKPTSIDMEKITGGINGPMEA